MSHIAAITCSVFLVFWTVVLLRGSGYSFDLRQRSKRRVHGGRRASDHG